MPDPRTPGGNSSTGTTGSPSKAGQAVFNGVLNGERDRPTRYLHCPRSYDKLAATIPREMPTAPRGRDLRSDLSADDLAQAGWGVVFPRTLDAGRREAIQRQLEPLLSLRRDEAGSDDARLFRDDLVYLPGETPLQFLQRYQAEVAPVDPRRLPYYLLFVGSPQEIPFELQYQLGVAHAVGRLCFETPEEYGNYARGVADVEVGRIRRPRRTEVFSVRNWDDPPTRMSTRYLAEPLAEALGEVSGWQVDAWTKERAHKARLMKLFSGADTPPLLFTNSHGLMFYPDDPLQPTDQGSLLCYDWPGPEDWTERIPPEFYLAPRDIADDADLRGVVTFHFACFSAGTPRLDSFTLDPCETVPIRAPQDSLALLPQRLLGKNGGAALAVIAHIDQVWEPAYLWPGLGPQLAAFEGTFRTLMAGRRAGLAMRGFGQRYATIATLITSQIQSWHQAPDSRPDGLSDELGEAFRWLAHNDARGYVLLGDPAVHLSLEPPRDVA